MKKVLYTIGTIYLIIVAIITVGVLNYNEHNLTQLGGHVYIKAQRDLGNYSKGSLIVVKEREGYVAGDNVFFCKLEKENCVVTYGRIDSMMSGSPSIIGVDVSKKLIIGIDRNVTVIPVLGSILSVLESRVGYFCFIILPILLAFLLIIRSLSKVVNTKK